MLSPPVTNAFLTQPVSIRAPSPPFSPSLPDSNWYLPSTYTSNMAATCALHPSDLQANSFLQVQNISRKVEKTSCAISKGCHPGERPKPGSTQWNGELASCKIQALGSSNVKRDNILETLAGVTRLFLIYIYKFYLYTYISSSISFFHISKTLVFLLHSEMWAQSPCIPAG